LNQTSSYELQKNYYQDMVNRNSQWKLVDIYADADTPYGLNTKSPWTLL